MNQISLLPFPFFYNFISYKLDLESKFQEVSFCEEIVKFCFFALLSTSEESEDNI